MKSPFGLLRLPDDCTEGPLLVHTDAQATRLLVPQTTSRSKLLTSHLGNITELADGRDVWMPTFNYDFCRTGHFDCLNDKSVVGPISEHFRTCGSDWRTICPVFNFAGVGSEPDCNIEDDGLVDPFDGSSVFAQLVERGGSVVWYGAPFSSTTLIHHVETICGRPVYRYDKIFPGTVRCKGTATDVTMRYHVRPSGFVFEYDWPRLLNEVTNAGIIKSIEPRAHLYSAQARSIVEFWRHRLSEDPLYFLDRPTRLWVEDRLEELGRRFEQRDFEDMR